MINRRNLEDAVKTAQWLQTKHEWEKHIEFIRTRIGTKVLREDLDNSVAWYERIFGKLSTPNPKP